MAELLGVGPAVKLSCRVQTTSLFAANRLSIFLSHLSSVTRTFSRIAHVVFGRFRMAMLFIFRIEMCSRAASVRHTAVTCFMYVKAMLAGPQPTYIHNHANVGWCFIELRSAFHLPFGYSAMRHTLAWREWT